jgi:hypothetical protein
MRDVFDILLSNCYSQLLQPLGNPLIVSIHIFGQGKNGLFVLFAFVLEQSKFKLTRKELFFVVIFILCVNSKGSNAIDQVKGMIVNFLDELLRPFEQLRNFLCIYLD